MLASDPVFFTDLLSDAMRHYEAGDYEEAILTYNMVLEIEPRDFEALFGLGKSYRGAKRLEKAIEALEAATQVKPSNGAVILELGNVYLEAGRYEKAKEAVKPLWETETPDVKAGIVLLLSLAAEERMEDMKALLKNEQFAQYLEDRTEVDNMFFVGYDSDDRREGYGIGLYAMGYVYVGEYMADQRSGNGKWYYPGGTAYFSGQWKEDLPNGAGEFVETESQHRIIGHWKDGLQHGEIEEWFVGNPEHHTNSHLGHWKYTCENGIPLANTKIQSKIFFAACLDCENSLLWCSAWVPIGLSPFAEKYDSYEISSDIFED